MKNVFNKSPVIYLITKGEAAAENFAESKIEILELIKAFAEAGIPFIQIREKKLPARLLFDLASSAKQITRNTKTKLLVNDRADIALAAGADGVHLTSISISPEIVRRAFPADFIIGASAHTMVEAENAKSGGADFVTFSPIFSSPGKGEPIGLKNLKLACERLKPFPVVALGGINAANFEKALESGASGFAAIRFLNEMFQNENTERNKIIGKFLR